MGGAPLSPEAATKVTPAWPAGVWKVFASVPVSVLNSPPPQLMETTTTPGWLAAKRTAVKRLLVELVVASTRRILALGAIAWAHSTSSAISLAHPPLGDGRGVVPPVWFTLVRVGSGRPNRRSNW